MLKVNEIFFDLQSGTTFVGFPSVFIVLAGGTPGSHYATLNTKHALNNEKNMTIEEIVEEISRYNCYIVVITGGEPLAQDKTHLLITALVNKNYLVLLETNGTMNIKQINNKAIIIMKIKYPNIEDKGSFQLENLKYLRPKDQLKFYISSSRDYHWSKELIFKNMLFEKCNILFFANQKELQLRTLTEWIISDQLPVRVGFNVPDLFR